MKKQQLSFFGILPCGNNSIDSFLLMWTTSFLWRVGTSSNLYIDIHKD